MGQYRYESEVRAGQVVNLMKGMDLGTSGLFTVCTEAENSGSIHALQAESYWGPFPVLAGCSTVEELAQALFQGFLVKGRKKEYVAGALLKGSLQEAEEKRERFARYAGLDTKWLDSEKYGYVLVRVPRVLDGGTEELTEETERRLQEMTGASVNGLSQELFRDVQGNIAETGENISVVVDSLQGTIGTHYSMKAVETITKFGADMDEAVSRLSGWEAEHPGFTECPTAMDWEIFMHDCKAQIVPLEKDFPAETARYQSVLENIVSCARQQDEYMSQISRIQAEMSQHKAQADTAEEQENRLKEFSANITSPDWQPQEDALADMGQYAAVLAQKEQAMLLRLVTLIHLQSGAMEYQYCGTWEPVTSFTLKSVRENLADQSLAAIQGMQSFLSVPTDLRLPLLYEAQIPAEALMGENGGEIEVPMDLGMWRNLSHVRINAMDVRLEGIRTSSGRCHVKLVTSGDPVKDRGIAGKILSYQMPSRDWFVVYDTVSDRTIMYTEPSRDWGKYFAKPAPFQKIRIGLAGTPENDGASFREDMVNVKVWFYLEACYRENAFGGPAERSADGDGMLRAVPEFIKGLEGHTITGGWDVINFMSVTAINNLWKVRWQKEVEKEYGDKDRQFLQSIDVSYSADYPGGITVKTRLESELDAPEIQFLQDGLRRVQVTIPIICGKICIDTIQGGETIGHKEDEIQVSETNRPFIRFALDINKIAGSADNSGKVFLTPSPEAVSLENIQIEGRCLYSFAMK